MSHPRQVWDQLALREVCHALFEAFFRGGNLPLILAVAIWCCLTSLRWQPRGPPMVSELRGAGKRHTRPPLAGLAIQAARTAGAALTTWRRSHLKDRRRPAPKASKS